MIVTNSLFVDLFFEDFMLNPADLKSSYSILHYSFLIRPGNVLTLQKRRLVIEILAETSFKIVKNCEPNLKKTFAKRSFFEYLLNWLNFSDKLQLFLVVLRVFVDFWYLKQVF